MIVTQRDLPALHFEHKLWMNELNFYVDEVAIYEHRLEELITKYGTSEKELLRGLEHFQNQFIRQKEVLDALRHDIRIHESGLARLAKSEASEVDVDIEYHDYLREQVEVFRKIYDELKKEFYAFLKQWMK